MPFLGFWCELQILKQWKEKDMGTDATQTYRVRLFWVFGGISSLR